MKKIILLLALVLSPAAQAAKFSNPFTEFELPPQWNCILEGAEWVCQNTMDGKKADAVMVVLAKIKNEADSIENYLTFLKASKSFSTAGGKSMKSEPLYAKSIQIGGQQWVDALHKESEIPGFNTRYLATVKQDIGVLVSVSVVKEKWQSYIAQIDEMVKTIKVFRKVNAPVGPANPTIFDQSKVNVPTDTTVFGQMGQNAPIAGGGTAKPPARPAEQGGMLLLLLAAGAGIGFVVWKKKRNADS